MSDRREITQLLEKVSRREDSAPDELMAAVYEDLRRLAHSYFQNERDGHTLQPTALVHEAYIRLVDWENVSWQNRAHFFAVAADVMRKVLIDHARRKKAAKRNSENFLVEQTVSLADENQIDLLFLEDALRQLAVHDQRQARIVELRFFGGLKVNEVAYILDISERTVKREWAFAKAWLRRQMLSEKLQS